MFNRHFINNLLIFKLLFSTYKKRFSFIQKLTDQT
jgi:hypothetical protein